MLFASLTYSWFFAWRFGQGNTPIPQLGGPVERVGRVNLQQSRENKHRPNQPENLTHETVPRQRNLRFTTDWRIPREQSMPRPS